MLLAEKYKFCRNILDFPSSYSCKFNIIWKISFWTHFYLVDFVHWSTNLSKNESYMFAKNSYILVLYDDITIEICNISKEMETLLNIFILGHAQTSHSGHWAIWCTRTSILSYLYGLNQHFDKDLTELQHQYNMTEVVRHKNGPSNQPPPHKTDKHIFLTTHHEHVQEQQQQFIIQHPYKQQQK